MDQSHVLYSLTALATPSHLARGGKAPALTHADVVRSLDRVHRTVRLTPSMLGLTLTPRA